MTRGFKASDVRDAKRVIRGDFHVAARAMLRARDGVHSARWRYLMLAGGAPQEEIACIRSLVPRAHITAVDLDPKLVELALAAGADVGICADIYGDERDGGRWGQTKRVLWPELRDLTFDVVNLDVCAPADGRLSSAMQLFSKRCARGSPMMVTFSYGRDVVEVLWKKTRGHVLAAANETVVSLAERAGVSETLVGRLATIAVSRAALLHVALYRGAAMPMCATLWETVATTSAWPRNLVVEPTCSFTKYADEDLDIAVANVDASAVYAAPAERVEAARRSAAALKAVRTRREKDDADADVPTKGIPDQPCSDGRFVVPCAFWHVSGSLALIPEARALLRELDRTSPRTFAAAAAAALRSPELLDRGRKRRVELTPEERAVLRRAGGVRA